MTYTVLPSMHEILAVNSGAHGGFGKYQRDRVDDAFPQDGSIEHLADWNGKADGCLA